MNRLHPVRVVVGVMAMLLLIAGVVGAYSYGQDYYQHRGFTQIVQLPRAGTGRLLNVDFYSRALHRKADYLVYLPPGYSPRRRYPVYYLLHGMPGQPKVFIDIANMDVRLDNQLSEGHLQPMILVYPDGRIGGSVYSDSEWANTSSGHFESYVVEVVNDVAHRFSTLSYRGDRVIGGFSAGAYGAINVALHHLAVFGSVQVWSGYFPQTRTGVFARATRAELAYDSPMEFVSTLSRKAFVVNPLRVFMFSGRDDEASVHLLPMARALTARGVRVRYALYPGGHDWSVWYPRLNTMLILASRDMRGPPRIAVARRHRQPIAMSRHRRGHSRRARYRIAAHMRALARYVPPAPATVVPRPRPPVQHSRPVILALVLALLSAAAINLGFVLQHRGLTDQHKAGRTAPSSVLRSRSWLAGQALGWAGFLTQIVAVAIAPLSLVQAFAAGGLALSVPIAAGIFGARLPRGALVAVLVIAAGLFVLPIGFTSAHGSLRNGTLIGLTTLAVAGAIALGVRPHAPARAIAAGVFYGVADAAIKAESVLISHHGPGALLSAWMLVAALATFGGFLAFQAALRSAQAVNAIALMNAFAALAALALGVLAFGESLGSTPAATAVHLVAIALVLVCVAPLAHSQQQLADGPPAGPSARATRFLLVAAGSAAAAAMLLLTLLAGAGLLYGLRAASWFALGPRIGDALPLLQLARFDAQPLARVIAAWLPAGVVLGLALIRLRPLRRAFLVAIPALVLLLFASDACFALARNLRLEFVLRHRIPAVGPWLEALLLAAGAAIPLQLAAAPAVRASEPPGYRTLASRTSRAAVGSMSASRAES